MGQWRKIVLLKEKEIGAGTTCLETSLSNMLRLLGKKLIPHRTNIFAWTAVVVK